MAGVQWETSSHISDTETINAAQYQRDNSLDPIGTERIMFNQLDAAVNAFENSLVSEEPTLSRRNSL